MLEQLSVRNYAIMRELVVDFSSGFTVLTGETGAGKSILIGALGLLGGGKADADVVRAGQEQAEVAGVFVVEGNREALAWLGAREIEPEDGRVVVRRVVRSSGRSSAFIQAAPVTVADLEEFSGFLFDIHGQHEHQSLFRTELHRQYLDAFGGLEGDAAAYAEVFRRLTERRRELEDLLSKERDLVRERELLAHAVEEIEAARLTPGEDEQVEQELSLLSHLEQVAEDLKDFFSLATEGPQAVLPALKQMRRLLGQVERVDRRVEPLGARLESAYYELEDVTEQIRSYREGLDFSPERLEAVAERSALIQRLKRKYGDTVEEVLSFLEEARRKLSRFESYDEETARLRMEVEELQREVLRRAKALMEARVRVGEEFARRVETIIRSLGMQKARFSVQVEQRLSERGAPVCTPSGMDRVEFLIAPNPGEDFKPLRKIASGGEISRVMLAIKTLTAQSDPIATLVFDEVDTGIGGEVALAVGEYLYEVARYKQVLCITHIASIAARGDHHLVVRKRVEGNETMADIEYVEGDDREEELARMLSGDVDSRVSREHARELLMKYGGSTRG
ncbi:DNA repair protein RecN [Spirochaeta thermophila DSM 6578]|uniref:DNA repair protein RecN n=1 Tax=Winmispira thermophila (strain ATCC 700085 / DSM 6578 / Z-1203) TaxID=869211 RepID=G0GC97_WINT7|nr:DNA repair protein RecN [Spirochaeta thermophila]AEJ61182.1 DNA repair protein RecN [Spirochaeta thermophila DSM 6578]